MRVRVRIAGHPLHPAFVHFPAALWPTSLAWDLIGMCRGGEPLWAQLAFWSLAAGLIAALPAIVSGFLEYASIPQHHRALLVANAHLLFTSGATVLFLVSLVWRGLSGSPSSTPGAGPVWLSGLATALLAAGGWLGGTLVYRYRIGCDGADG